MKITKATNASQVKIGDHIAYANTCTGTRVLRVTKIIRDLGNGFRFRLAGFGWTYAMVDAGVVKEYADDRLREFTKDWSAPEKLVVEDVIAGRAIAAVASIDRRRDPGRPWKAA